MGSFARIALVAAMLTAISAQTARAATPAITAELKQIHVELIDLDPTDGITPWISFQDGSGVLLIGQASPWGVDSLGFGGAPLGGAASAVATAAVSSTFVHMEASAGDILVAGSGPTLRVYGDLSVPDAQVYGHASIGGVFTVSAKTRVVVSAQPGQIDINLNPAGLGDIWAMTGVGFCPLDAEGRQHCFDSQTQTNLFVLDSAGEIRSAGGNRSVVRQSLSISWDNEGASEQSRYLSANAFVLSSGVPSPVPEPSHALLLVAGLAVIGRRLSRQA